MGLIGKLKEFERGDEFSVSKVDPGGGFNVNAPHFSPPGDDSQPLPEDQVAMITTQRTNGRAAVGYIDFGNEEKAGPGEKRIYARDSGGMGIVELWLKSDGSATISNAFGAIKLLADGSIDLNGVTIDPNGAMSVPLSLKVAGKEVNGHPHGGVTVGAGSTLPF